MRITEERKCSDWTYWKSLVLITLHFLSFQVTLFLEDCGYFPKMGLYDFFTQYMKFEDRQLYLYISIKLVVPSRVMDHSEWISKPLDKLTCNEDSREFPQNVMVVKRRGKVRILHFYSTPDSLCWWFENCLTMPDKMM